MDLVVCSPVAREGLDRRLRELPGLTLRWAEVAELPGLAAHADAMVLSGTVYGADLAGALNRRDNRCRWLQLLSAGYELLQTHGVAADVAVSSAGSVWSPIVAEHAIALLLALARRLPKVLAAQGRAQWDDSIRQDMGMLIGGHLVVVGMGSIGGETARRARAFGMKVTGVSRRGLPHADADEVLPLSRLHDALGRADAVLVAVPLSVATVHLIDAAALAACPPHALICNVARGAVIDPVALLHALQSGRLGGAALDVTEPEPLPPGHPLWTVPNTLISPHLGGAAPRRYYDRLVEHVVANVRARLQGQPLADRVEIDTP